jgi:hypothetical protein
VVSKIPTDNIVRLSSLKIKWKYFIYLYSNILYD